MAGGTHVMTRPQAVQTAQELWADGKGGWTITDIRDYLANEGQDVSWPTVKSWVNQEWWDRRLEGKRQARHVDATPELLLALRLEDGLTYTAIAKVAKRFLGVDMTAKQARYQLTLLGAPKNPAKARAAREQNNLGLGSI